MILERLKYDHRRRRIMRGESKTRKAYEKAIQKAKQERQSRDRLENLYAEERLFLDEYEDKRQWLQTRYLTDLARYYWIPVPEYRSDSPMWTRSTVSEKVVLSNDGVLYLDEAINKKRRERREAVLAWIPAATAISGLMGVATGLAAMLDRCASG